MLCSKMDFDFFKSKYTDMKHIIYILCENLKQSDHTCHPRGHLKKTLIFVLFHDQIGRTIIFRKLATLEYYVIWIFFEKM